MSEATNEKISSLLDSLSPQQRQIVTADSDDNLLVLAPPGTGKTHTVIARIKYLIEEAGLDPHELLVLCFTRAAVSEIMQRIRSLIDGDEVHDDLRFVAVSTFDSYATRLLFSDEERQPDLAGAGYDKRIEMAIDALSDYESAASYIVGNCRHLIVDELQDVVTVRAELVRAILRLAAGGFTFLGDPAQAIYGFTDPEIESDQEGIEDRAPRIDLIEWVRNERWPGGLSVVELGHNYRSEGRLDAIGQAARQIVLSPMADRKAYTSLMELIEALEEVGELTSTNQMLTEPQYDSVCILCRTNGELLQIASLLAQQEIPHAIRPRSTEYALPAWIGRVLGPSKEPRLSFPSFEKLWHQQINGRLDMDPRQAFGWLKRVEGGDRPALNIQNLRNRLYSGSRLPDDADAGNTNSGERLSLSTIHSAKGREFDHVIILTPDGRERKLEDNGWREEARVLYVAATRARKQLSHLGRKGLHNSMWLETVWQDRRRWVTRRGAYCYMEIGLPDDLSVTSPVNSYIHQYNGDAHRAQNMLWSDFRPGTPLYISKNAFNGNVFFRIAPHRDAGLEDRPFAQLSRAFKDDLAQLSRRLSGSSTFSYPSYWTSARVTRVVTEVLPPYPENVHEPFAQNGFCLGIRIRGLIPITGMN